MLLLSETFPCLIFLGISLCRLLSRCSWPRKSYYVQNCMVTGIHTYASFKCCILPPVWSVYLGGCENREDSGNHWSRRTTTLHAASNIWDQRALVCLHNQPEPLDFVDILHLHSALGARQPLWWDGNRGANYAQLLSVSTQLSIRQQFLWHWL